VSLFEVFGWIIMNIYIYNNKCIYT
jgi:hypothetical protein